MQIHCDGISSGSPAQIAIRVGYERGADRMAVFHLSLNIDLADKSALVHVTRVTCNKIYLTHQNGNFDLHAYNNNL